MTAPPAVSSVVLGVPVDDVTLGDAVEVIAELVTAHRSSGRTHQVVTVNVDFVVNALADRDVLGILQRSDLSLPDGAPLVWMSRLAGTPVRERTAGADLVAALAERAATDGWRLLLFGGAAGVADAARDLLVAQHPGADVVAVEAPVVAPDGTMDDAVAAGLRAVGADVVCVALGNPKQERWIDRHRELVGAAVYIGVGGTLDFLTGTTTRAPGWMQRVGLEWLHRAASDPRRLARRYARDIVVFLPRALREAAGRRRTRGRAAAPVLRTQVGGGPAAERALADAGALAAAAADARRLGPTDHVVVEPVSGAPQDPRLGHALATVVRQARRSGATVALRGASPELVRRAGLEHRRDLGAEAPDAAGRPE